MGLTSLDITVLAAVLGAAVLGLRRGFTYEVLALAAWVAVVFAVKLFHLPATEWLSSRVGTPGGAATLALLLLSGGTWFIGRLIANRISSRTKRSVLGPVDRALGFGFGALKGLIVASVGFLLATLLFDTVGGGPSGRPAWMRESRTYPLLNATSAGIADFVDRRRKGQPVFDAGPAEAENASEAEA
ncbi:MAG TPA: CvpA family protein [Sphingomonas sp.]|jgi:membrane protein required for colicin V production